MPRDLTLYKAGNSICSQKVLITLAEKKLEFETVDISLFENEQYSQKYLAINPKGVVPALDHAGTVITESTLICEYLDERFGQSQLIPSSALHRARMRKWSKIVDEGLFEATREISFSAMFREKMRSMTEEQRQIRFMNIGDPERRARYVSTYEMGIESPYVFQAVAIVEKAVNDMEYTLAQGGPWLVGEKMTLADINLMPFIARLEYLGLLDIWTSRQTHIVDWWTQSKNLTSYHESISSSLSENEIDKMRLYGQKIRADIGMLHDSYRAYIQPEPAADTVTKVSG